MTMQSLTVLYDAQCSLCCWFSDWLNGRPQLIPLELVPAGSARARARHPALDHARTLQDITVIADTGEIYTAEYAWVMCLWATADHRVLAERLARPAWLPVARVAAYSAAGLRDALIGKASAGGYAARCE